MPKNNKHNDNQDDEQNDDKKDQGKDKKKSDKYEKIKKRSRGERNKKKKVKVYLPAIIASGQKKASDFADFKQMPDGEPEMTEAELSYKDALLAVEIEKLAAKGFNNDEIIEKIGISRHTFYERLREEPYFSYAIFRHRGKVVYDVKNALLNNALGFEYKEDRVTAFGDVVQVRMQKLPETRAQETILYNLAREEYRRKPDPIQEKGVNISKLNINIKRRA